APPDLLPYLCSQPGDGAELCCVPDPQAGLGGRWATLATVGLVPGTRSMSVLAGPPTGAAPQRWRHLSAAGDLPLAAGPASAAPAH
ncbi:hypothetical protein HER39_18345, partial [Arthrobacter deserti]|nr:hypothetical protein [Arthrobacter deserti]